MSETLASFIFSMEVSHVPMNWASKVNEDLHATWNNTFRTLKLRSSPYAQLMA